MSLFPTSGIHNYRYPELSARFFSSQFSMITGYCLFHGRQPDAVMQDILFVVRYLPELSFLGVP